MRARGLKLPGLGDLLTPEQRRKQQRWQRVVQQPKETIFSVVADVESYSKFLPWCLGSRILSRSEPDANGASSLGTEICVGFELLKSEFRSQVTVTPPARIHAVSEPNEYMDHLTFTWDFESVGESACRLDLMLGALCCTRGGSTRSTAHFRSQRARMAPCTDFSLRNAEHLLLWEFAQDKVISEYVRCFVKRCAELEAIRAGGAGDADGTSAKA